jgi:hypothetical protein
MEEEKIFGKLFGTIPLYSEEHLDILLTTMDKSMASTLLVQAVKLGYESQLYSIGESEVISKAIRVLTKEEVSVEQKKDDE